MPRKRRSMFISGKIYHLYNRGNRKSAIFYGDSDKRYFLKKVYVLAEKEKCNIEIVSYCLMDNHYHLVVKQLSDISISRYMQRLMTSFSQYINTKYRYVGHTFQGRFNSKLVRNNLYLHRLFRYLRQNPIESGYVTTTDHYGWMYVPEGTDLQGDRPRP